MLWIQPNLAGYPDQYYDGVPDFASATPIAVAGDTVQDITLTGPPATYTLSGTLTAGTPHDGSTVHLLSAAGDYLGNTATSGGGSYSFTVSPGDYVLWIQPNLAGYPDQYFDGVPDFASATPIAVAGDTVQDITLTGPPATYTLSGTLTAGTPHDGSTVHLLSAAGDYLGNTATSGGGSYSFTVSPGDYVLWIQPNLAGYPDQYYDGVPDFASATPIAVAGDTVQDITLTGPPATYTLSGTLTAGTPHDGSTVHLLSAAGDYLGNTATSGGGSYSFTVSPGDYVLWIQPNLAGYPDQYYDGVPDFASATPIAVAGDTVQDITLTGPPVANTAPVAVVDSYNALQAAVLNVAMPGVLGNDTDAENDPLTAVLDTSVTHGTLTLNANGSFTYTPTATYNGTDSFTYHANDGTANSSVVTVSLAVATYFVDNTNGSCSDAGAGSLAAPYCTMAKGASKATAGQAVRVLAGTYAEVVKPNSGTAGNPVTFSAAPGVTVTGPPDNSTNGGAFRITSKSYIVVDGFMITGTADYGIILDTSSHITISNNHVSYSGTASIHKVGIYLRATTDSVVTGNTTDHNTMDGIRLNTGSNYNIVSNNESFGNAEGSVRNACGINLLASSNYNTIIHNVVYANEDTGLNFYTGSSYNLVVGNLTYGNGDHGIDNNAAPNQVIVGNTVQGNVTVGINLEGATSPGSGGATVANNVMVDNGLLRLVGGGTSPTGSAGNIRVDAQSLEGTTLDYNLYFLSPSEGGTAQIYWGGGSAYTSLAAFQTAQPTQEISGLEADPLLTAPAPIAERPPSAPFNVAINPGDYHLSGGSPAIDSANSDAPNQPSLDIEGQAHVDDPATANTGAGTRTYDDRGAHEFVP